MNCQKITLKEIFNLLDNNIKFLIITPTLNLNSKAANLYYLLKNSKYYDKIFCNGTIVYDKQTKTRIRENIIVKGLSELKNQCIFTHIKSITPLMLKEHLAIFIKEFKNIPANLKIDYIYDENFNIKKEVRIESRLENHFRLQHDLPRPKIIEPKYFIFDTETNGLPLKERYRCCSYENNEAWKHCRILSIAWIITDSNFKVLKTFSSLVMDNTYKNSISAQCINKIKDEDREELGLCFSEIMTYLNNDIMDCNYIVSHGSDFDFNLLISECIKREINTDIFKNKIILNTKQNLWKTNYKQGLSDLVQIDINTDENVKNLKPHDALYDSYLCLELLKIRLCK